MQPETLWVAQSWEKDNVSLCECFSSSLRPPLRLISSPSSNTSQEPGMLFMCPATSREQVSITHCVCQYVTGMSLPKFQLQLSFHCYKEHRWKNRRGKKYIYIWSFTTLSANKTGDAVWLILKRQPVLLSSQIIWWLKVHQQRFLSFGSLFSFSQISFLGCLPANTKAVWHLDRRVAFMKNLWKFKKINDLTLSFFFVANWAQSTHITY